MSVVPDPIVVPDPKKPFKAIAGALVTFLALIWANVQGSASLSSVMDWVTVIVPAIIAFGAVYGVPNPVASKP